jgi:hypothetical protein
LLEYVSAQQPLGIAAIAQLQRRRRLLNYHLGFGCGG